MKLFRLEHQKLWKPTNVKIGVLVCLTYVVVFGSFLSYQWFQFGTSDDYTSAFGNNFDGYSSIQNRQAYAAQWAGSLSDEKIKQMVKDYQERATSKIYSDVEITDWQVLNGWIELLWPELKETDNPKLIISYVDSNRLTGFYERRQDKLEEFFDLNGLSDSEKEYFRNMDSNVESPFHYDWVEGWSTLLGSVVADFGIVMALFIAMILSPIFSGEWHNNMHSLIFTTKNGLPRQIIQTLLKRGITALRNSRNSSFCASKTNSLRWRTIFYTKGGQRQTSGADLRTKINVIKANSHKYSVSAMCKVLKVSGSTYYYEAKQKTGESELTAAIIDIFKASRNNYGTRKIK